MTTLSQIPRLGLGPLGTSRRRGITYILYDKFTTDRAAGAVNGTLAEPTGGVRTVVDTNGKLSVSGGKLSFATGGVADGNPGVWYPVQTRKAGLVFFGTITPPGNPGTPKIGWDNNQSGDINEHIRFTAASTIVVELGGAAYNVAGYSKATAYQAAVVLRTAGIYYFIKGGAFTNWTYLYSFNTGGGGSVYPAVTALNTTSIFTADNIRIPKNLWLPTPLAYDTFTRADGAAGSTETSGPDAQATPSLAWTSALGTFGVTSNAGKFSALDGGGTGVATLPTSATISVLHAAALTRSGGVCGVVVRWTDINNHIRAVYTGTNAQLIKVVAGTPTTLVNVAASYGAGRVLRVICDGTAFRLYYHNSTIGAQQTISDAALQSGAVGLYTTDANNTFDNVTTFPRGTGGEYSQLDKY